MLIGSDFQFTECIFSPKWSAVQEAAQISRMKIKAMLYLSCILLVNSDLNASEGSDCEGWLCLTHHQHSEGATKHVCFWVPCLPFRFRVCKSFISFTSLLWFSMQCGLSLAASLYHLKNQNLKETLWKNCVKRWLHKLTWEYFCTWTALLNSK